MPQLEERLKRHRTAAFASGIAKPEGYVFATTFGTPTYYRNLSKRGLEEAATDAGINVEGQKKLGMHDLRHTSLRT